MTIADNREVVASDEVSQRSSSFRIAPALLLKLSAGAALVLAPWLLPGFAVFQLTIVLTFGIAIIGLNLLTGCSGQFSLGHNAFYAVGAYTAAILMDRYDLPYFLTLPVAALFCFIFGFLVGFPALRLDGLYLALATFGLAVATPQLLKLSVFGTWTGGAQGISLLKPDAPFGIPLTPDQWLYLISGGIAVGAYLLAKNLVDSRSGRALMAIRDNPIAARSMGVNVSLYKTLVFGVSAAYTGVAGALSAIVVQYVSPDSFSFTVAITMLVGLIVGGARWLPGAFVGSAFVLFVPNIAEHLSKGLSGAVYGLFLILIVFLLPSGAGGLMERVKR